MPLLRMTCAVVLDDHESRPPAVLDHTRVEGLLRAQSCSPDLEGNLDWHEHIQAVSHSAGVKRLLRCGSQGSR